MIQLDESISVWAYFENGTVKPHIFFWNKRQIKIDKINLVHTSKNGGNIYYHFSISSGGNFYRITLDLQGLKWVLEAVEEE